MFIIMIIIIIIVIVIRILYFSIVRSLSLFTASKLTLLPLNGFQFCNAYAYTTRTSSNIETMKGNCVGCRYKFNKLVYLNIGSGKWCACAMFVIISANVDEERNDGAKNYI